MNKGPESSIGYHTTLESLGIPQDALDKGVRNWQDYDDYLKEQAAREEYLETLANKDYDALTNFERHTLEKATRPEETIIEEAKKPLELGDTPLDDDKNLIDISFIYDNTPLDDDKDLIDISFIYDKVVGVFTKYLTGFNSD